MALKSLTLRRFDTELQMLRLANEDAADALRQFYVSMDMVERGWMDGLTEQEVDRYLALRANGVYMVDAMQQLGNGCGPSKP